MEKFYSSSALLKMAGGGMHPHITPGYATARGHNFTRPRLEFKIFSSSSKPRPR